ncbi:LysR family transcriptional regulator [Companilactobacillus jidongensis]|uniref:LysR family transcriptional regulator n=1 Tax=Companilactobacillus jidongensis TaxID=2486006 RepID=UPI0013DDDF07|nr:LysR family transcriptional regulator [Companilactobacillus jidongensis]
MDLQLLQNFLIVAQEENITHAAEFLHISQPALSRQIKTIENEFGKQLLIRENKRVTLTKDGVLLRKRAIEINKLISKTTTEMAENSDELTGDILIGVSETDAIRYISSEAKKINNQHPKITLKMKNGNNNSIINMVNNGLVDFGLYFGPIDTNIYDHLTLQQINRFGVLMSKDNPLANKSSLTPTDLRQQPLILYQEALDDGSLAEWFHQSNDDLNIVGTFDMYLSAKKMVEGDLGMALVLDNLVDYTSSDYICQSLSPEIKIDVNLIWKKYQIFSEPAQLFLDSIRKTLKFE